MSKRAVFVLGYTGATGKALVKALANDDSFRRVVLIGRREVKLDVEDDSKFEQKIVEFDNIEQHEDAFSGCDAGFCLLGTTTGVSGRDGFVKVDKDYVVNSAKVAKATGCKHFLLTSTVGADTRSLIFVFKIKGQAEEAVKQLGFERLSIFRPGALDAKRERRRLGEELFIGLMVPVKKLFPTRFTIPVEKVAQGLVAQAKTAAKESSSSSVEEFDNRAIYRFADDNGRQ